MSAGAQNGQSPYGLIAGNGRFPLLVLAAARERGERMVVAAIKEETWPEIEKSGAEVHWLSLGQLGRLIDLFHQHGVSRAIMAGQVQHKQIFSSLRPDWRMVKLLASLAVKNTDSLLGAVVRTLAEEGIVIEDSRRFLEPLLAGAGALTPRAPDAEELSEIQYGWRLARLIAGADIGQTVVIAGGACVAVEAMEGTDAAIRRAAKLAQGKRLTVVKVARPQQDVRFDVPVIGPETIRTMAECQASALAVESGLTLLLERERLLAEAAARQIAIFGRGGDDRDGSHE